MRVIFKGLLIGLTTASAGQVAAEDSQQTNNNWPPAAIAESRLSPTPIAEPKSLTFPQQRIERFERSTPDLTKYQVEGWIDEPSVDQTNAPPVLVSPVIELPPRDTRRATPSPQEQAWEQIRQRERMRADARRARIAYRKAIGYSPARPTIRGSILQPRVVYYPLYPFGIYGR